jgi:hypothetical protein
MSIRDLLVNQIGLKAMNRSDTLAEVFEKKLVKKDTLKTFDKGFIIKSKDKHVKSILTGMPGMKDVGIARKMDEMAGESERPPEKTIEVWG